MDIKIIQKGYVLICRPNLMQDIFSQSVILLVNHNAEEGSLGFVLNKKTTFTLADLLPDLQVDFPVFEGGPVDTDNLFYLHRRPDLISQSELVDNGIFWSGNFNDVKKHILSKELTQKDICFYLGYSGWAKGQLQGEIKNNSWYVLPKADFDLSQIQEADLWKNQMKKLGGKHLLWMNMPENPELN